MSSDVKVDDPDLFGDWLRSATPKCGLTQREPPLSLPGGLH